MAGIPIWFVEILFSTVFNRLALHPSRAKRPTEITRNMSVSLTHFFGLEVFDAFERFNLDSFRSGCPEGSIDFSSLEVGC